MAGEIGLHGCCKNHMLEKKLQLHYILSNT